ncbi:MAG: HAD-superfamily hydrolase, subfamily [Caloramator sp.]|jgi:hypothetical protein|uniref:HAD family hydrolase n=1 Tax=Caloramator sp. TaxID=1871330 RepID=UPI001DE819C4|nr:HAD family hydrolase [Caloramator sp.]MBZ4664506.1 HAD-superfamily hydrolase, subfamily [Caloramator sp.]
MDFKGILVVSDLDGTLMDSNKNISKKNIETLRYFVDKGGLFTVATGRTELNIRPFIKDLPINCPAILYNGAAIYDFKNEKFIKYACLDNSILAYIIRDILYEYSEICVQIFTVGKMYIVSGTSYIDPYVINEKQPYELANVLDIVQENWLKVIFNGQNEMLKSILKKIEGIIPKNKLNCMFSTDRYLEILPFGVSKGSALKELIKLMEINQNKVVAIGDYCNDIEMIKVAFLGVATENAHKDLKKAAKCITVSNDNNAVATLINEVIPEFISL